MNKAIALLTVLILIAALGSGVFDTYKQKVPGDPDGTVGGPGCPNDTERASHTAGDPGDAGDGYGNPH